MIDGQSLNLTQERIKVLKALVPDVFSEDKIDWERLRQAFGEEVFVKNEHYELSWAGKAEARREIQRPTTATLIPDRLASVDFDKSDNVFIEGENLEVLRVLQRAYFGRVKMIYIDPPYNTGNDSFVYPDDYAERLIEYRQRAGKTNDEGFLNKQDLWHQNRRENGQFHSAWLSMIYPRLFVGRNLLREDGVIFVSIDDNEVSNLKIIMDEIFGEENFIVQVIWKRRSTPPNDQVIGANHEYLLIYAKSVEQVKLNLKIRSQEQVERYKNPDNHPKGPWTSGDLMANVKGGRYVASLHFPIINPNTGDEHYPSNNGNWRFNQQKIIDLIGKDEIHFGDDGKGRPKLKRFLIDVKDGVTYPSIWDFIAFNSEGSSEMAELLGNMNVFDNPKPSALIKELIRLGCSSNGIILDFFAGSATTAQSVMDLNAEDGGNRSFILVQLPELTDLKSEAYKAGYHTIADISRDRIRHVIKKRYRQIEKLAQLIESIDETIDAKNKEIAKLKVGADSEIFDDTNPPKVIQRLTDEITKLEDKRANARNQHDRLQQTAKDFRAYKLAPSNFNVWQSQETDKKTIEQLLLNFAQSDKTDADTERMLTEFMLKNGHPLNTPVEVLDLGGVPAYSVANGRLLVLLDGYNEAINTCIWETQPKHVVCLDRLFAGRDELLANLHLELRDRGIEFSVI